MHLTRTATAIVTTVMTMLAASARANADEAPSPPPQKNENSEHATPTQAGADPKMDDAHEREESQSEQGAHAPARQEIEAQSAPPKKSDDSDPDEKKFTVSGYVETFYQWNFNNPGNGITNYRGYDNRHNALTLANAVLDTGFRAKDLLGRIALQFGHTPAAYYSQEPQLPGTDGANETNDKLWRYLQRASVGWQPSETLLLEGGLFLTSYGVEGFAVKDNWNWSRTNAFVRLPTYQTGFKATIHANKHFDVIGGVYNGWNSIVDNNDEKSIFLQGQYKLGEELTASVAYFGGVEREGGAPEGRAWRHAAQSYVQYDIQSWLEVAAEADGGFEDNRFGLHWFAAGAAWARFKTTDWMYLALRGDSLWEDPSANVAGSSRPFVSPAKNLTSGTATIDVRPVKGLSTRLEYRYDHASSDVFFAGHVEGDGSAERPYVPNTRKQNTILFGATAWF